MTVLDASFFINSKEKASGLSFFMIRESINLFIRQMMN